MTASGTPVQELGYCRHCLTNVQHQRTLRTSWGRWLDRCTGGIGRYLGIGTWLCMSCGSPRWLFPPYRKDAGEYDPRRSSARNRTEPEIERAGNVLDRQMSLVERACRRRQYTPRFRARIVEMILHGEASFTVLRQRLELSEIDLQDWIAQYHRERLAEVGGAESPAAGDFDGIVLSPADDPKRVPRASGS